jgi:methylmalonyl-CoA/ethylmalonyl-CoA epimerase
MFEGLDHVGIAVRDLDAAGTALERIGFVRRDEGVIGPEPQQGYPGLNARWRLYGVSPGDRSTVLLEPLSASGPVHDFLERHGPGVQHIAYTVTDAEATKSALEAVGIGLARPNPYEDEQGNLSLFLEAGVLPGVLVEMTQWKDES